MQIILKSFFLIWKFKTVVGEPSDSLGSLEIETTFLFFLRRLNEIISQN
jgi:hypothetical protein